MPSHDRRPRTGTQSRPDRCERRRHRSRDCVLPRYARPDLPLPGGHARVLRLRRRRLSPPESKEFDHPGFVRSTTPTPASDDSAIGPRSMRRRWTGCTCLGCALDDADTIVRRWAFGLVTNAMPEPERRALMLAPRVTAIPPCAMAQEYWRAQDDPEAALTRESFLFDRSLSIRAEAQRHWSPRSARIRQRSLSARASDGASTRSSPRCTGSARPSAGGCGVGRNAIDDPRPREARGREGRSLAWPATKRFLRSWRRSSRTRARSPPRRGVGSGPGGG